MQGTVQVPHMKSVFFPGFLRYRTPSSKPMPTTFHHPVKSLQPTLIMKNTTNSTSTQTVRADISAAGLPISPPGTTKTRP